MRIAVIDMGTNSTRLLVAEVEGERIAELDRRSTVTRLGRGVDTARRLSAEAIEDVCGAVAGYVEAYSDLGAERVVALATSAVRDAENGAAFVAELRERFGLEARVLTGEAEAGLTYLGATRGRAPSEAATLVVDIGGGSTEIVVGRRSEVAFHASLDAGTVRHSERHIRADPPRAEELEALAADVRSLIDCALARSEEAQAERGIAVAGTPTSLAAIDQRLEPYDPDRVHGYVLSHAAIERIGARLSSVPLAARLEVPGLHPGRAPTIPAGVVILTEVMRAFGLTEVEVSERDILDGAALEAAAQT